MNYPHNQRTYTVAEAMRELKVSRPTIYQLINDGTLETYTIGRRRYTTGEMIDQCIEKLSERVSAA